MTQPVDNCMCCEYILNISGLHSLLYEPLVIVWFWSGNVWWVHAALIRESLLTWSFNQTHSCLQYVLFNPSFINDNWFWRTWETNVRSVSQTSVNRCLSTNRLEKQERGSEGARLEKMFSGGSTSTDINFCQMFIICTANNNKNYDICSFSKQKGK